MKDPGLSPDQFRPDKIVSKEVLLDSRDRLLVQDGSCIGDVFRSGESEKLKLVLPLAYSDLSIFNRLSLSAVNRSADCLLVGVRLLHGSSSEDGDASAESFSGGREELPPGESRDLKFPLECFGSYGFPKGWSDVRCIELTFGRERTFVGPEHFLVDLIGLNGEMREVPPGPRLTQNGLASLLTSDLPEVVPALLPPYLPDNPALFIPPPHSFPRETAEEILNGRIMGQEIGLPIPWDANPLGAQEWTHFLNRHHFTRTLVQAYAKTGDERFTTCLDEVLSSWIEHNPVPLGSNGGAGPSWETLSAAWRLREWLWIAGIAWAAQLFRPSTRTAMLCSIWEHARHLMDHKGHPNNWIIVESAALTLAGLCFPQFREADTWVQTGLERLTCEFRRQFFNDGVHFEISPLYHSICLDAFLEVKEAAAAKGKILAEEFDAPLANCVSYLTAMCRPDFTWPAINDSNGIAGDYTGIVARAGRVFRRADCQWVGSRGSRGKPPQDCFKAFPDAGIAVIRSDYSRTANFLVFRAGPPGAAHVHGDSLSLDIAALGVPLVVDPGITAYAPGPRTDYYRSAMSHSMPLIDGEGPHPAGLSFRDRIKSAGDNFSCTAGESLDMATGVCRDPWDCAGQGITILRTVIFIRPEYWIVRDIVRGSGFHEISACWHFAPSVVIRNENLLAIGIVDKEGSGLKLTPILNFSSSRQEEDGWVSLNGADVPAAHYKYTYSGRLPLTAIWLLTPTLEFPGPQIETRRFDRGDGTVSLDIEFTGRCRDEVILGPPPEDPAGRKNGQLHGVIEFIRKNCR